jgi:hypothetical protein
MKEKKGGERKDAKHVYPMSSLARICGEDDKESKKHICISCDQPMFTGTCCGKLKPWLLLLSVHTRLSLKLLVSCCCEWQMRQNWLLCTKFNAGLGQIEFSFCGDQRDCDCFWGVWVPTFFFCAILVSMFRNGPSHFIPCVIWDPFPFKILPSS